MTIFIGFILLVLQVTVVNTISSPADSLPAFKSDSAALDPFRKLESGSTLALGKTGLASGTNKSDTGKAYLDSLTAILKKRIPALSVYLGVDFFDFNGKEQFQNSLATRISSDTTLAPLQTFENVHLAFPLGLQLTFPVSTYLDLVAKTHSYWYQQTAIIGNKNTKAHVADETFNVQANLGGVGLRYYLPPALISVTGQMTLFAQTVWYWNLGQSEIYSPYGNAQARFNPLGSGYEIQVGYQQPLTKAWQITNSLGFIHQEFESNQEWKNLVGFNPSAGKVNWSSSGIQANLFLEYHFGFKSANSKVNSSPTN